MFLWRTHFAAIPRHPKPKAADPRILSREKNRKAQCVASHFEPPRIGGYRLHCSMRENALKISDSQCVNPLFILEDRIGFGRIGPNPPESIKIQQNPSKSIRIYPTASKSFRTHQNHTNTTRLHQNPSETVNSHHNPAESIEIHQNPTNSINVAK